MLICVYFYAANFVQCPTVLRVGSPSDRGGAQASARVSVEAGRLPPPLRLERVGGVQLRAIGRVIEPAVVPAWVYECVRTTAAHPLRRCRGPGIVVEACSVYIDFVIQLLLLYPPRVPPHCAHVFAVAC